ncbi:dTDP-4-dehydrorhamnose reductase [Pseudoalteromonas sp. S4488]|uniref:dTDP-4-dehydrorhamnose reductase n=1 Tax=unclassified Pseudoalteromonas TaxID=194690 RepID=UPI001023C3D1|nr:MULTISPECIES: dTDP-4-dehydrorhamnose reductase [unclassified Pseudoalteromonas]RZF77288.1 dTDP-4-dehydrorhamnose reductase [Pseudoalteromonas sp. CO109Y]TMO33396.1 dTDP-4-dehydrorhamnose reductase [Pseudoalteromonas sp. S4491]TMO33888.1 dTDP-4-dehydrorhamnose reductase [Pseudoalteromonas sp. S4488]
MKVLLTGANGQLGLCFQDCVSDSIELTALSSKELDITCKASVQNVVDALRPDVIVNCAAYTAVDKAESEPELAHAVNCQGPENLAYAAAMLDIPLIHVSTDYVFDGNATEPYVPTDATSPQGVYGQTKLAGEQAIKAITSKHIVIRTAWVFSEYGNNFVKTMLRLASERDELGIVADQHGCPTYAGDLAALIVAIVTRIESSDFSDYGLYHFCGDKAVSWFEFAESIFELQAKLNADFSIPKLNKLTTEQFPTPAKRPKYSVMQDNRLSLLKLPNASHWQDSLKTVLKKLNK